MELEKDFLGKVKVDGYLEIKRNNIWTAQICPFSNKRTIFNPDGEGKINTDRCGDWCPLFSEPVYSKNRGDTNKAKIEICHGKLIRFSDLSDER